MPLSARVRFVTTAGDASALAALERQHDIDVTVSEPDRLRADGAVFRVTLLRD